MIWAGETVRMTDRHSAGRARGGDIRFGRSKSLFQSTRRCMSISSGSESSRRHSEGTENRDSELHRACRPTWTKRKVFTQTSWWPKEFGRLQRGQWVYALAMSERCSRLAEIRSRPGEGRLGWEGRSTTSSLAGRRSRGRQCARARRAEVEAEGV